jgi:hypothetical protein
LAIEKVGRYRGTAAMNCEELGEFWEQLKEWLLEKVLPRR